MNKTHVIREAPNISGYRLDFFFWKNLFSPAIYCPEVEQEVNYELGGTERKPSSSVYSGILLEVLKIPKNNQ